MNGETKIDRTTNKCPIVSLILSIFIVPSCRFGLWWDMLVDRASNRRPLNAEQMDFTSVARRWNTSEDSHSLATSVNVGHYYSLVGWETE
jgi:hypothetical protein